MLLDVARLIVFPALIAFAACSDLLTMTISNRVSLALIAGFLALALVTGMDAAQIGAHVGAGLIVLAVAFVCFARGWIGGGDAKLAAATVLWLGFDQMANYLLLASIFGGALTLAMLRFRVMPMPAFLEQQAWAKRLHRVDAGVPYGIALAAAALIVYPDTAFMQGLTL